MSIELKSNACGYYKIEAFKGVEDENGKLIEEIPGSRRIVADWFPNIITNGGLERMAENSTWYNYCQVGTGTSTPVATDTTLDTYLVNTTTVQSTTTGNQASSPYYAYRTTVYRFGEGVAEGNLSEVGVGWSATTDLYSRALILDGGGSPTTITVLSDEYLDVTYQLRIYPPTSDITGTISLDSITYDYTGRAGLVTGTLWDTFHTSGDGVYNQSAAFAGNIGSITSSPSGTNDNSTSITPSSYSATSYEREATVEWGLNDGNIGGVRSISSTFGWGYWQFQFDSQVDGSAIPKDNTKILSLSFKHSWARGSV